jgi:hypothetical protein
MAMKLRVVPRAQSATVALMLAADDGAWLRIDAAADDTPRTPGDAAPAVVLTGRRRDQVDGLLDLRGGAPIQLYATPAVFEHLTLSLPLLPVLQQFCGVQWHLIPVAGEQREAGFALERCPTLAFTAITAADAAQPVGESIALAVRDERSGGRLFVGHGRALGAAAFDWMREADCALIDGALEPALLERFAALPTARKVLTDADGRSRAWLAARGIECADAALEIAL